MTDLAAPDLGESEGRVTFRLTRSRSGLAALKEYISIFGDALVPVRYVSASGIALGNWVSYCRKQYKAGRLSLELVDELDSLPQWTWSPQRAGRMNEARHAEFITQLRSYVLAHGDARVPQGYVTPDGVKLGVLVSTKRVSYRDGSMPAAAVADLELLAGWTWDAQVHDREAVMTALRAFVAQFGHSVVPQKYVSPDGSSLGIVVAKRRELYKSGRLTAKSIAEFESLKGWAWDGHEAKRQAGMSALRAYSADIGNGRVPQGYVSEGAFSLGSWIVNVRNRTRIGKLSPEFIAELDAIDETWRCGALAPWESEEATTGGTVSAP